MGTLVEMGLWLVPAVLIRRGLLSARRLGTHRRSLERVFTEPAELAEQPDRDSVVAGFLRRWLFLAGYRQPGAPAAFVAGTLLAIGLGLAALVAIRGAGLTTQLSRNIAGLPPGVGDLLVPITYLAPWTVLMILVLVPWLIVRRSRRQRIEHVEQDLPISLELLATLSEAGLGFDAALSRVLDSAVEDRPLAREFRTYQSDLLAGRTRSKPCGDWPTAWKSSP